MNKKILYIAGFVIIILVSLTISLFQKLKTLEDISNQRLYLNNTFYEEVIDNLQFSSKYNNNIISNTFSITTMDNRKVKLKDIIGNKAKLVYIFKKQNCKDCIDKSLDSIKVWQNKLGCNNIIILTDIEHSRDILVLKNIHKLQVNIYRTDKLGDILKIQDFDSPFWCVIDPSLHIVNLFLPFQISPELLNKYLYVCKNRYFNN